MSAASQSSLPDSSDRLPSTLTLSLNRWVTDHDNTVLGPDFMCRSRRPPSSQSVCWSTKSGCGEWEERDGCNLSLTLIACYPTVLPVKSMGIRWASPKASRLSAGLR